MSSRRSNDVSVLPSIFSDSHITFVTIDSRDSQSSVTTQNSVLYDWYQRFLSPVALGDVTGGSRIEMALYSFVIPYTALTYDQPHYLYTDQTTPSAIGSEFRQLLAIIAPPELMGAPAVPAFPAYGQIYGKIPEPLAWHRALPSDQLDLLQANITAGLTSNPNWVGLGPTPPYVQYTFCFRRVN